MTDRGYQYDYSCSNDEMHSYESRTRKAVTMVAILREEMGDRLGAADVLNLGCSTGIIDQYIAKNVRSVTGVDIDVAGIELATSRNTDKNVTFQVDDAMHLSFTDDSFDVVICSQVYEHVPDARRMMSEIYRVLRQDGVCYFAATNRWAIVEKHYHLPFLSWLPTSLANRYVRILGRGNAYYERHLGRGELFNLVARFQVVDYTPKLLSKPDKYAVGYLFGKGLRLAGARIIFKVLRPFFPGFIWLLCKRDSTSIE